MTKKKMTVKAAGNGKVPAMTADRLATFGAMVRLPIPYANLAFVLVNAFDNLPATYHWEHDSYTLPAECPDLTYPEYEAYVVIGGSVTIIDRSDDDKGRKREPIRFVLDLPAIHCGIDALAKHNIDDLLILATNACFETDAIFAFRFLQYCMYGHLRF